MQIGPIPPASIYATWSENVELWSVDDDTLMDLTEVTEVIIKLIDQRTKFTELTLTMTNGDIILPSDGIIQWRVEVEMMGTLVAKLYEFLMQIETEDDTIALMGVVSVVD